MYVQGSYRAAGPDEAESAEESGSSSSSRCIGMGYGKTAALRDVWITTLDCKPKKLPSVPFISTDCEVSMVMSSVLVICMFCKRYADQEWVYANVGRD